VMTSRRQCIEPTDFVSWGDLRGQVIRVRECPPGQIIVVRWSGYGFVKRMAYYYYAI